MLQQLSRPTRARRTVAAAAVSVLGACGLVLVAAAPASAADDTVLTTGERLVEGDRLVSPSGRYALEVRTGELLLTERANAFVAAVELPLETGVGSVVLQGDGNLVVLSPQGGVLSSFETDGSGATAVRVQDDRNIVFSGAGGAVVADASTYQQELVLQGTALLPGDAVPGAGGTAVRMQTDGNLVLYRGTTPLWDSRTSGNPGAAAVVQADGNLVVYAADRRPLYASGSVVTGDSESIVLLEVEDTELSVKRLTAGGSDPGVPVSLWASNSRRAGDPRGTDGVLVPGDELEPGEFRTAGACTLVMQADGNLVEYCSTATGVRAVFSTGVPRGSSNSEEFVTGLAIMQPDGNFVVYRVTAFGGITGPVFDTRTRTPGSSLVVQADSNVVVYGPAGRPTWSRTTGRIG
ncbi:hypothetical protein [Aquipuribacter hungaricus]|uniref:Bulb-type lectin domain-containing protein n=1 Tax=Aquipuribacter hungaricus TaxID=545624 RepID=A0ABV7WFG8_9MICO